MQMDADHDRGRDAVTAVAEPVLDQRYGVARTRHLSAFGMHQQRHFAHPSQLVKKSLY
jgi:hypothetical protein